LNKNKKNKRGRRGKKKKNKKSKGEKSTITFIPGDEISDKNSDLMKKIISKESSTFFVLCRNLRHLSI
jgi:hypothetical protein